MKQNLKSNSYEILDSHTPLESQLLSAQIVTSDQMRIARIEQKKTGKQLEKLLIEMGFVTEKALTTFVSEANGVEKFHLETTTVDPETVRKLPKEICERHKILLVSEEGSTAYLAMVDIHDILAQDAVRRNLDREIICPLIVSETELLKAIDAFYGYEMSIDGILQEVESGFTAANQNADDYTSPTVRLLNAIILDAVKASASDIHFEPEGSFLRLRYRIDGMLVAIRTLHISYWASLCVRLKVLSAMDIANGRLPENGRFSMNLGAREVDFRVSSHPTVHGENIVIRILDKSHSLMPLEDLGFGSKNIALIKQSLKTPSGLVVITGPTGSGKTTTLYSMLNYINSPSVNIMTLEEPVEYRLPLIRQTNVTDKGGPSFADGVKSILRQDPDVIFIGEVRDEETASMALRASMTGHQVYTTLHTSDVFGVIYRLQDLGLKSSILAGNMISAVAQRLVRKLCTHCKVPVNPTSRPPSCNITKLHQGKRIEKQKIYKAQGCEKCAHTGYSGRTAVAEILHFTESMNDLISANAPRQDYKEIAREEGFVSMADQGMMLVEQGLTSLEECERVLGIHR